MKTSPASSPSPAAMAIWLLSLAFALPQLAMASERCRLGKVDMSGGELEMVEVPLKVASVHDLVKRDITPRLPYDPETISGCTFWYDNTDSATCLEVRTTLNISAATFSRWNPSITLDCKGWYHWQSYCIEVVSELPKTTSSSTATTTTTTQSSTSVTPRPTPAAWEPLGCYIDNAQLRTLRNRSSVASGSALTISKCQAACWAAGFDFAGVEAGNECWCGYFVGNEMATNQTDCNKPCTGETGKTCGGTNRLNVYQAVPSKTVAATTTTTTRSSSSSTSTPRPTGVKWLDFGCFLDLENPRTLSTRLSVSTTANTISGCQSSCRAAGYSYAGLEYGKECWCGNSIQAPTSNTPAPRQLDCAMPCTGDKSQICGGSNRINIYGSVSSSSVVWSPMGCYLDLDNPRTLSRRVLVSTTAMTPAVCQSACLAAGYPYAGNEYAKECWCGSALNATAKNQPAGASDCDMPCTGDGTKICGGSNRLSIYKAVVVGDGGSSSPGASWISLGCYADPSNARILRKKMTTVSATNNTRRGCMDACERERYKYAAVEYGKECWCDFQINNGGAPAPDGTVGCNMPCTGKATEICGGSNRMNMFYNLS